MKCANIPVFVSHRGCPFACSFCNQREINGVCETITAREAKRIIEAALATLEGKRAEIAFFGGSFTGIPIKEQEELLGAAYPYVKSGKVTGIRLSTRPDYIDEEVLARCKNYGVIAIELGAQSMDEEVLRLSGRGHSAEDVRRAARMITDAGIELGLQMMLGLPGDSPRKARKTAEEFIALSPSAVRIYPCLVLKNTALAEAYKKGEYMPLSLDEAIEQTADLKKQFGQANISVIRMGLQPSESLEQSILAGPYHPAFGELVSSRILYRKIEKVLRETDAKEAVLSCPERMRSRMVGQKKENLRKIEETFRIPCRVEICDDETLRINGRRIYDEI